MTRPIPPELQERIEAHERWLETTKREGQGLAQGNMDLHELDLSGRALVMVALPDARLDRAVLRGTNLSDSNLCGASFIEAELDGAWLVKTDAWNSNFSEASLRGVRAVRLDLQGANLQKADLTDSNFYNADFSETNLEHTNFSNADLRQTYFYKAHMAYATLTGALLWGAELAGATGLELVNVEWIDIGKVEWTSIGEVKTVQKLEGEQARLWLLEKAAKSLPTMKKSEENTKTEQGKQDVEQQYKGWDTKSL